MNITLIGMPGAGKSTIGVLLAKTLGRTFTDTDLVIQAREKRLLQEIIREDGIAGFLRIEEQAVLSRTDRWSVIATGGSVVYSQPAMRHLKANGVLIYLELPYDVIESRLKNITTRGIVIEEGHSLMDIYKERVPLYEYYADITLPCVNREMEQIIADILYRIS